MTVLGIWDSHEGIFIARIETTGTWQEALVDWLVAQWQDDLRGWRLDSIHSYSGLPMPEGFDEVAYVWEIDMGVERDDS